MGIFDAINIFSKGINTMADSNADKIAQVKAFQEVQEANGAKQTALRRQAAQLPEGPERDALLAQREQLRKENREIQSRINQVAPDDPKNAVYEGKDPATGSEVYVNPVTGQRFNASAPPSDAQKANSIPNGAEQSDKARETAIAADNKSTQQGYAGAPQPVADAPASERKTSPVSQEGVNTTVENGTDSGVTVGGPIGDSQAPVVEKQLDDGSDPYVSNGESTIPQPTEQQTPEDPYEAARLAAAAENNQSPTEQQVLEASSDANLSKEQQNNLEKEQENNRAALKAEEAAANNPQKNWTAGSVNQARPQQTIFVARNAIQKDDWRIRLSLAPSSKYLYKIAKTGDILYPLASTDGVIFPYTPAIQTAYRANYDPLDLTHSNYKLHFYKNSNVDDIQLTADFSAQDTSEANYLLAVIHFFRSVTKMFYGQDGNNGPQAGTPPPLCYLNGYGQYQFNEHPVLVSSFTYNLPNDVDYIRAGSSTVIAGTNVDSAKPRPSSFSDIFSLSKLRAQGSRLKTNSMSAEPNWTNYSNQNATYVPTKMQIQLTLIPVVTRNDITNNFSVEKYATGELLKGRNRKNGGGIW